MVSGSQTCFHKIFCMNDLAVRNREKRAQKTEVFDTIMDCGKHLTTFLHFRSHPEQCFIISMFFIKIIMKKSILFFADSLTHKAKSWNLKSCWEMRWWYFYLAELYSDNQININSHSWICILKSTPPVKSFVP